MIYKNEYENCIHFDGKECRNGASCNYGSYGEFCIDCEDIEGADNMNEMNKLFDELWWVSDESKPMNDFIEAIKQYTKENKGSVYITLIDLFNFGYRQGYIFIAFDDLSGGPLCMFKSADFVKYYKEILNQAPEMKPEEFWIPKLTKITLTDRD